MDWGNDAPKREEQHSPTNSNHTESSAPARPSGDSLDLTRQRSKKRKLSFENLEQNGSAKALAAPKKAVQDRSHSVVEKRYRENLNQKIADLRDCIPNLRQKPKETTPGGPSNQKQNKATVLTEAMSYIRQLEKRNKYLEQLSSPTRETFSFDESIRRTHPNAQDPNGELKNQDECTANTSEQSPDKEPPKGLIPVPEEMRRLWAGRSQEHYADRYPETDESSNGSVSVRGGKQIGRLVFGSLAGMMIFGEFTPPQKRVEKREDRGLSALPMPYLFPQSKRLVIGAVNVLPHVMNFSPLAKAFLVFSLCGLMLFFYLYYSKPPPRKNGRSFHMETISSLASPLEVRQNAWLTSIQTVWVPRRHFFLEMLALVLETAGYFTRKLLGLQCYSFLTGRTGDEEIARVRAWEIALDAQLSGGDPELSKSRLVLTLWASGTLPNTPARLMLKAMHIRVLFWQPSRFAFITKMLHRAAGSLARQQWIRAAQLQQILEKSEQDADTDGSDPLPDHLKALLKKPCDDVLSDVIVQRAYNLAWNIPNDDPQSGNGDDGSSANDSAMLGPLDKLGLWHDKYALP